MVPLEQVFLLIICILFALIYNFRGEVLLKRRFNGIKKEIKGLIEKKEVSTERKIIIAAIELSIFLVMLYFAFTMKIFWVVVVSNSMSPTFERGDMVLIQSIFVDPKKGDIVMFYRDDMNLPVTHRVLKVEGDLVYTGGDSSGPDYSPVPKSRIIGEAVVIFGKPIVVKGVGNYFILDAKELRDITPFGQEYLFYKNLVDLFKKYALAIIIVAISAYVYLTFRDVRV